MGWQEINGCRYFYRSTNTDGIITTEHFGRGVEAALASHVDVSKYGKKLQQDHDDQRYISQFSNDLEEYNKLQWWINYLARADGLLAGFIRHNCGSEWRQTNAE
jgi:hypothetical protein